MSNKKTTFSDTTKTNDGRAIDFSVKSPRLDSCGQQLRDTFGNPRFSKDEPYKWLEYLKNAGLFILENVDSFIKYDFETNKFKYVTEEEKPTNQELVSYANMVMSNVIDTMFDGLTYSPDGESRNYYIKQTQIFEEVIRLRSLYVADVANPTDKLCISESDNIHQMLAECKRRY